MKQPPLSQAGGMKGLLTNVYAETPPSTFVASLCPSLCWVSVVSPAVWALLSKAPRPGGGADRALVALWEFSCCYNQPTQTPGPGKLGSSGPHAGPLRSRTLKTGCSSSSSLVRFPASSEAGTGQREGC